MSALPKQRLTEEEYLLIERAAEYRSEYIDGEMYAMAGAKARHAEIITNTSAALHAQLRGRGCKTYTNDLRVRVADSGLYTYPDIIAHCGKPRLLDSHNDTLLNPQLIIEVLSPSTESYDRGEKFRRYRQLESLADYVLIAQDKMLVEQWTRQTRDLWNVHYFSEPTDLVLFAALTAQLALSDIYEDIDFTEETPAYVR